MQIDWIGRLNWFIQLPVRTEGLLLLGLYLLLTALVLAVSWRSFVQLTRKQWFIFGGLAVTTIILSNVVLWRFTAPSFQPVPNLPQEASVPSTPLLAPVPLLLAAGWLGPGPTVLLAAVSGFIQAGFQSGQITQRFEVIAYGLLVSYLIHQNYRGLLSAILRRPLIASSLAALITWPVMMPSFFFYTPGEPLAALNYAWPLFLAGLVPTLAAGVVSGMVAEIVNVRWAQWRLPRGPQTASPWSRTLTRRMVWAFITFTMMWIVVLVYAVSATALAEAKRQSIAQMSRDALSAAREVPSFFQTGQGLIQEFAADDQLRNSTPALRLARLSADLRTGPFFDQLLLYDANGLLIDHYPPSDDLAATGEERELISRTLQTRAPQMSSVFLLNGQGVIAFNAAVIESATDQVTGVLLGRTRLQLNPMIVRLRDGLQNTLGAGTGHLVDEFSRIVVHRDSALVLSAWSLDPLMKPILTTPDNGAAYEDRFPDGTPRLLFVQPAAGTNWLVVIELPVISVLQLALQISTPLLIILLIVGLVAGVGLSLLTRAITRPIQDLSRAAERIAQGQLDRPVTLSGDDEVGRLGSSFEQMRLSLKDRLDDLSLLLRVSQTVSSSLDLERGVPPLLAGAMQVSPAHVARLVLLSDSGSPDTVLSSGEGTPALTPLDRALTALAAPSEAPILIDNVTRARARDARSEFTQAGHQGDCRTAHSSPDAAHRRDVVGLCRAARADRIGSECVGHVGWTGRCADRERPLVPRG